MTSMFSIDSQFWSTVASNPWQLAVHLLDIGIVAWLIYRFIRSLVGTKIMSLVQGVVLFVFLKFVAGYLGFTTITFLMNQVVTYGIIAAVVIFAPEIRSGLEHFGRTPQALIQTQSVSREDRLVKAFVDAVKYMSPRKIGALISVEGAQTLQEYISTGIPLNATISSQLLINIFIPNTPLHDGAVIVSNNEITVACAYLPLSESNTISKEFGTRHRAAIGLSEKSDAFTVIVSEETGAISVTHKGILQHDLSLEDFEAILKEQFVSQVDDERSLIKKWFGGKRNG